MKAFSWSNSINCAAADCPKELVLARSGDCEWIPLLISKCPIERTHKINSSYLVSRYNFISLN